MGLQGIKHNLPLTTIDTSHLPQGDKVIQYLSLDSRYCGRARRNISRKPHFLVVNGPDQCTLASGLIVERVAGVLFLFSSTTHGTQQDYTLRFNLPNIIMTRSKEGIVQEGGYRHGQGNIPCYNV